MSIDSHMVNVNEIIHKYLHPSITSISIMLPMTHLTTISDEWGGRTGTNILGCGGRLLALSERVSSRMAVRRNLSNETAKGESQERKKRQRR